MSFKILLASIVFVGLLNAAVCQPGITFDAKLHCWINVTSAMNVTYTPQDYEIINEYLNVTVFEVVDELPFAEQGAALVKLESKIINDMFYTVEVPITLMDLHSLSELVPGSLFFRYFQAIMSDPDVFYDLMVIAMETMLHTCVDDEVEPDYRFILRHIMEELTHFLFEDPTMSVEAMDATLNITSAALIAAWEAIDDVGIDFNIITLELVEGLLIAFEKYAPENFDVVFFANDIISSAQEIAPKDVVLVDADVIIKNATDILGIEL
eukprot:TRINITY_DN73_c0_g1_i2.p1 TRINITY_DN73_c0_g1~~TRINITY_DN73_c0_g1_i2.p1  ORF type:complete len:299 (+),score=51.49 TRINITY_DN73_c0_g1_i2:99-899(+)